MDNEEEKAKKTLDNIKEANDLYYKKLKALNDKKAELFVLQSETLEALQNASNLNDQFNTAVNKQLLFERDKLKEEVKKLNK